MSSRSRRGSARPVGSRWAAWPAQRIRSPRSLRSLPAHRRASSTSAARRGSTSACRRHPIRSPCRRPHSYPPFARSQMTEVFFGTNRLADASASGGFGALRAPEGPGGVTYGTAEVNGGRLGATSDLRTGQWSDATLDTIVHAGKPVLVSIHGFDYTFSDAIGRAGELGDLYRRYGADTIMIAF